VYHFHNLHYLCYLFNRHFCLNIEHEFGSMVYSCQDGWTAFICASFCGHTDIVKLLLKEGADVDAEGEVSYATSLS